MATYHFRMKTDKKPDGTKVAASAHVEYVNREGSFKNVDEKFEQVFAASHLEYINREAAFTKRGGVVFTGHQLPKWAKDSPKKFFTAADRYEGNGNRRYREIEFSLPNEFTTAEQYKQVIDKFLQNHFANHYYAYAVHEKIGLLSDGERHPHVHIMFSERMIDEAEKQQERTAKNFFSYPLRRKNGAPSPTPEELRQHGAPKNRRWTQRSYLEELRRDFADILNETLAQNGFSVRVDHRTLEAQKADALQNGDNFLAQLLDRVPEKYLGVIVPDKLKNPNVAYLRHNRQTRQNYQSAVYAAEMTSQEIAELESKNQAQTNLLAAKNLLNSDELKKQVQNSPLIAELRDSVIAAVKEVNLCKQKIIGSEDAEEKAKLEYLTADERQVWIHYHATKREQQELTEFCRNLHKPQDFQEEALKAHEEILAATQEKIRWLSVQIDADEPKIRIMEKKLNSPSCRKNIERVAHTFMQNNYLARQNLDKANQHLANTTEILRQAVFNEDMNFDRQEVLSTRDVFEILRRHYDKLKREHEQLLAESTALQKKIISPNRAMAMAENIFTKGAWKKYRTDARQYAKQKKRFDYRRQMLTMTGTLAQEESALQAEENKLIAIKKSLDAEHTRLENLCQSPQAQEKIRGIAAGILRKNSKIAAKFESCNKQLQESMQQINRIKIQLNTVKQRLGKERISAKYRIKRSIGVGYDSSQKFTAQ